MQQDWKKLVAYSSVSHLGFCTLGIFALNPNGIAGSVIQQINHGISTGMLFLVIGVIYERRHTREISEYGGLAHVMPKFAIIFAIAMLSSAGLPLLNGFVGEFTILQGAFEANRAWAAFAVTGVILGAAYLLWLYQRTMLGQVTNGKNLTLPDMSFREVAMFLPLIAWAIWIGVYPKPYFDILQQPVAEIVERVQPGYYNGVRRKYPGPQPPRRCRPEARNELQPVLHRDRPLHHHPGGHAGAVRLRHPAVRFLDFPRSPPAQVAADLRGAGRDLHGRRAVPATSVAGGSESLAAARLWRLRHRRRLQHLLQLDLPGGRADRRAGVLSVPGDRRRASRRILRADPVRAVRHVLPGHRHGPGDAVHRPGTDGAVLLRDGRLPAHRQALQRGGAEVPAAGRIFQRLPGLRLLGAVRPGRFHQAGGYRRRHCRAAGLGSGGLSGAGHHLGRTALQDLGRALPHVGAGRLRRRAHHRHGLSFGGLQSRVLRFSAAHFHGPAAIAARGCGSRCWPSWPSSP